MLAQVRLLVRRATVAVAVAVAALFTSPRQATVAMGEAHQVARAAAGSLLDSRRQVATAAAGPSMASPAVAVVEEAEHKRRITPLLVNRVGLNF